MSGFSRRGGRLFAEDVPLADIAKKYGTPCYVYSRRAFLDAVSRLRAAFAQSAPKICYAVKANGNLSVLRLLREAGCGFDIVSGGELARVLAAGGAAQDIVFSGVGKSAVEIRAALHAGIGCFNVESAAEMARLEKIAGAMNLRAPVAVRATPDIDGGTHPHLTTGVGGGKFGVPPKTALALAKRAAAADYLEFFGFACHIGSQIGVQEAYLAAAEKMETLFSQARAAGLAPRRIDMGGGFAVDYENSGGLNIDAKEYDAALARRFAGAEIWIEPGRAVAAAAGVLLTRVEYVKETGGALFWITDAGMNDILRPALYGARHKIEAAEESAAPPQTGAVAGPVCESADILARGCRLAAAAGDLLAVRDAGAYCAAMMSGYNARPRPCEVLVFGGETKLIRRRETEEDMIADEKSLL
ncbi:MAG: diaminopimelate decarboxylase [Betaproteobacteria bacterium]|nr:diaminopimelate decarboxylase [Betaproteobacteria bacterium]